MLLTLLTVLVLCFNTIFVFANLKNAYKVFYKHLVIILGLGIFHLLLDYISSIFYWKWLYLIFSFPIGLLYGPIFLLLVSDCGLVKLKISFWKHLSPFYSACILLVPFSLNNDLHYQFHFEYSIFFQFFILLHMLAYFICIWPMIIPLLAKLSPPILKKELWYLMCTIMVGISIRSLLYMAEDRANINYYKEIVLIFYLFFLFAVSFLLIKYRQSKNINADLSEDFGFKEKCGLAFSGSSTKRVYSRKLGSLTGVQEVAYRNGIQKFIETRAFLDADMNKEKFCNLVMIPHSHVAFFLKQEFDKGFNGFINHLRLNYAARELKSEHLIYTIEDLSLICGFSSRASFYRNFQTEFGCSPHQFRFAKNQSGS